MADGYELSEDAARRTAAAVRRVEAMTPAAGAAATRGRNVPYKPAFYRLATNEGDGEYTCRRQAWDDDAKAFADVAESHQAEYDVDVTAYDYQERADGVAGAADVGQIVRGWKIHVGGATIKDGQWITLVDVGGGTADSPLTLGPSASDMANLSWSPTTNLDAADWDRKDQGAKDGVKIPICVRYHLSASLTMHHVMRDFTFDNQGALRSIGAESLINRNMDGNP